MRLSVGLRAGLLLDVGLHDLVEVGFIDHGAGLGALGLLLQVLAEKVQVEFAFLDLRTSLETIPEMMLATVLYM